MPSDASSPTRSPPVRFFDPRRFADVAVFLFCGLILLYSLLVVQQILLGSFAVATVLLVYYGVRFLRWFVASYRRRTDALESIAASLESMTDDDDAGFDR